RNNGNQGKCLGTKPGALQSVKEFTAAVDAYIDWYNAERLQLGLDGCTPMKYRDKALKTLAG
ncbi:IS3 family transposase, partial [uncultured Corynebacterium sp.]|uniref:IS3 family transposase n=3 Tax=Corynebacterium TaxID=1716 RepID=UPI0025986705